MHAFKQAIYESSPEHNFFTSPIRLAPPAMFRVAVEAYRHQKMAGLLMAGQPIPPLTYPTPRQK